MCIARVLNTSTITIATSMQLVSDIFILCVTDSRGGSSLSRGVIIGIAAVSIFVVLCLIGLVVYAILQKKRAERAIGISRPFGN